MTQEVERPGLHGQSYAMGPFACARDEALLIEFEPPARSMWGITLANFWWESLEFGARQSSLNDSSARVDDDGRRRIVLAHDDPGVSNWLDPEGHERGTLALRFPVRRAAARGKDRADAPPVAETRTARVDATHRRDRTGKPSAPPRAGPAAPLPPLVRYGRTSTRTSM